MALPGDLTTFTLHFPADGGTYTDAEGAAALAGKGGRLYPVNPATRKRVALVHVDTGATIVPDPLTITITAGSGEVGPIPHTDNETLAYWDGDEWRNGFAYRVEWDIASNAARPDDKTFVAPTALGADVDYALTDLSDVLPGVVVPVATGPQGEQGEQGDQGAQGIPGVADDAGVSALLNDTMSDSSQASARSLLPHATNPVQARTLKHLQVFVDWLRLKAGTRGMIGEVGWPNSDYSADGALWAEVAEQWYRMADRNDLWVTQWSSGTMFQPTYPLSAYGGAVGADPANMPISVRHAGTADVVERHQTYGRVLRGVNVSCLEWHVGVDDAAGTNSIGFSNLNPGVNGTNYRVEPAASWAYLYAQGVRLVRIPFRWERLQPTLGGALDATYQGYVQSMVAAARAAGLWVILDCHNYGGYWLDVAGTPVRQAVSVPSSYTSTSCSAANLGDLWRRIHSLFASDAKVLYNIMNEPINLGPAAGDAAVSTYIGDFEDNTIQSWNTPTSGVTLSTTTAQKKDGTYALQVDSTGANNAVAVRKTIGGTVYPGTNKVFAWVRPPNTAFCYIQVQFNNDNLFLEGKNKQLVANTWNLVEFVLPADRAGTRVQAVNLIFNGLTTGSASVMYIDSIGFGNGTKGGGTAPMAWERAAAVVVNTLRTNGCGKPIIIPTYDYSNVDRVLQNHPYGPWIDDENLIYEGHHYFSVLMNGVYDPWATSLTNAQAQLYGDNV